MIEVPWAEAIRRKYPEPVVLVISCDSDGKANVMPAGWSMIAAGNPPMLAVAIDQSNYTHQLIKETGEFVLAFPSGHMQKVIEYTGSRSGRDTDKFVECRLETLSSKHVKPPLLKEAVSCFECKLRGKLETGDHTIFAGEVLASYISEKYKDRLYNFGNGRFWTIPKREEVEMFDAVIFDWDGTLADTERFVVNAFQEVLKEIGCSVSDEFLERQIGIGARNMFKKALETASIPFDEKTIDELVEKKVRVQVELTKDVHLFEGAVELLDSLYGKVKIALATMSNKAVVNKVLKEKRIRKYFSLIVTADEVLQPKPDPEAFTICAERLGFRPERCVVIEDSIFGVQGAKAAKMQCIAVPSGAYSIEELEKEDPELVVSSLKEREKILNFVLSGTL